MSHHADHVVYLLTFELLDLVKEHGCITLIKKKEKEKRLVPGLPAFVTIVVNKGRVLFDQHSINSL